MPLSILGVLQDTLRVVVLLLLVLGSAAASSSLSPAEAVRSTINEVIRILNDKSLKSPYQIGKRRRLLEDVIARRFDYEEISKRTLGAQWSRLSYPQRRDFVAMFQTFLSDVYADKIETNTGEEVQYFGEFREGDYAEVRTELVSTKQEIPMMYRLLYKSGDWRVYDVVIEGLSLVANYRSQFRRVMRRSSYEGLVQKLREKTHE
jgi:phospholipid transport system substrate-binding protein